MSKLFVSLVWGALPCAAALFVGGCGRTTISVDGCQSDASLNPNCHAAATSSESSAQASSTAVASSSTGAGGCVGTISIVSEDHSEHPYNSGCVDDIGHPSATSPIGYEYSVEPPSGDPNLMIEGCVTAFEDTAGFYLDLEGATKPGSFTQGILKWVDEMGVEWHEDPDEAVAAEVTVLEPTGGEIDGAFTIYAVNAAHVTQEIHGTFHVCHVDDTGPP